MIPSLDRPSLIRSRSTYPGSRRSLDAGARSPRPCRARRSAARSSPRTERTANSASSRRSRGTYAIPLEQRHAASRSRPLAPRSRGRRCRRRRRHRAGRAGTRPGRGLRGPRGRRSRRRAARSRSPRRADRSSSAGRTQDDVRRARALGMDVAGVGQVLGAGHQPDELGRRASPRARVATVSPERITVTRSPISSISSIRCEMKIVLVASAARRRTIANSRSRVATSSAEVASSRIRIRGRRMSARAMQQAWRSLSESSSTGRARSGAVPVQLEQRLGRALEPLRSRDCVAGAAGRCRARGCRGPSAAGRRAPPGRPRRSRVRAPPAGSGSPRASCPRPRSTRDRDGGRRSAS